MCGIVGLVSRHPYAERDDLDAMRDALVHRGPDGSGSWWSADGRVGLGHRRLAILDLSPTGAQPMVSADGRLVVTFNGEIYNHAELRKELSGRGFAFRGGSDTEVLLNAFSAWGVDALTRLSGMFAFALYDTVRDRLLMARDRAGEKPLYWCHDGGVLAFASELKGLLARPGQPRRISPEGLDCYLTYGSVRGHRSILEGVHKLPAAHYLVFEGGQSGPQVKRYWDLPPPGPAGRVDAGDLADELRGLLEQSVRQQLVADVPVGVLLSGGIDSSIVTAIASKVSSAPVMTFTVGFKDHPAFDERKYAREISGHFGTRHVELEADAGTLSLVEKLARQFDEPMCDSSMIPTFLVSALVRQHCKAVLGGDGGDELFGGYRSYEGAVSLDGLRRTVPRFLRQAVGFAARWMMPIGFPRRNGLIALGRPLDDARDWGVFFDDRARFALCPWLGRHRVAGELEREAPRLELARGAPGAWMANDFRGYLADDILVKVDRASMLNSLEVRAPFLSPAICEWAFSRVPNDLRVHNGERKLVLKKLARMLLPSQFDVSRKQGFSIPLSAWISDERIHGPIMDRIRSSPLFDSSWIDGFRTRSRRGRSPELLFALWLLECWRDIYDASL